MNKEEILKRSRIEFRNKDEREELIDTKAFMYGGAALGFTFIILAGVKILLKGELIYDLLAMFEAFLAAYYFYKYKMLNDKVNLFMMLIWGFAAIINLYLFIVRI